jgi:hypothetical protein
MQKLIEWNTIDLRVNGDRINELVQAQLLGKEPLEKVHLTFTNGLLRVQGAVRKIVSIPFTVDITHIYARGLAVYVPLARISAAGFPIPTLLLTLIRNRLPQELVSFEEPATFVISLERFLPTFVTAEIQNIWIVDGGVTVTLGRGHADLPPGGIG